ncbi:hypothetical protein F5B20DRAFT_582890 [Whalleya microplaca]|nr:hypothetical protein F5B20DRAFT_582890 [Whalleya microplaca]
MPKRKKAAATKAKAEQRAAAAKLRTCNHKGKPNRKHKRDSQPQRPEQPVQVPGTLGYSFASLTPELRAEIFAQLLVRPVKWNATHDPRSCPLAACPMLLASSVRPRLEPLQASCATRVLGGPRWWLRDDRPTWRDPWRSSWAPEPANPFLCSACWDARFRPAPFPRSPASLPCLCARRPNLQVLLVSRAWYAEAGRVFYSRNTFAFGHPLECADFLENLAPRWRPFVSKVSLLALPPEGVYPADANQELEEVEVPVGGKTGFLAAWMQLGRLPALSELELDAIFLTRPKCVKVLRRPALKNLRRIVFVQAGPTKISKESQGFVWPERGTRRSVEDSEFAVNVARGIKGLRYGWLKCDRRHDDRAVEFERKRYRTRFKVVEKYTNRKTPEADYEEDSD